MRGYQRFLFGGIFVVIAMGIARFLDAMVNTMKPQGLSLVAFLIILIATMFVAGYLVEWIHAFVTATKEENKKEDEKKRKEEEKKRTKDLLNKRYGE